MLLGLASGPALPRLDDASIRKFAVPAETELRELGIFPDGG
jgi:hypothetical protein